MQEERPLKRLSNVWLARDREFWVSHEHRLVFLSIPKNANSYLRGLFLKNHRLALGFDPDRETVLQYHRRAGTRGIAITPRAAARLADYRRVVALRDPFARLVSAYLDKIIKPLARPSLGGPTQAYWRQVSRHHGRALDEGSLTFRRFADHVMATPETRRNRHCRSQTHYLGRLGFSFYGDIGDMDRLLDYLAGCGLDIDQDERHWHKRTVYGASALTHDPSRPMADRAPCELARMAAFPEPARFYDAALCQAFAHHFADDIALYARHTEQPAPSLIARYGA